MQNHWDYRHILFVSVLSHLNSSVFALPLVYSIHRVARRRRPRGPEEYSLFPTAYYETMVLRSCRGQIELGTALQFHCIATAVKLRSLSRHRRRFIHSSFPIQGLFPTMFQSLRPCEFRLKQNTGALLSTLATRSLRDRFPTL